MAKSGSSVGVGVTNSGSVGIGGAVTGSTTELARRFIPGPAPEMPADWGAFFRSIYDKPVLFIVLCMALGALLGWAAYIDIRILGYAIVFTVLGFFIELQSSVRYPAWLEKVKMYDHGWICLQCGHSWIPEADSHRATAATSG
jgi:hypothetical protein